MLVGGKVIMASRSKVKGKVFPCYRHHAVKAFRGVEV
jgi:hypothetical protein